MPRLLLALGALAGLAAVALSAWGAHAAPARLAPAELGMFNTAVQLLGWHAPALLAAGLLAERGGRLAGIAGALVAAGLLLFAGAVLLRALGGVSLGPVAPTGGVALLAGWALLAAAALRRA